MLQLHPDPKGPQQLDALAQHLVALEHFGLKSMVDKDFQTIGVVGDATDCCDFFPEPDHSSKRKWITKCTPASLLASGSSLGTGIATADEQARAW